MSRLIVVSNRVALPNRDKSAQGGLAVALNAALGEYGGIWFGWNGKTSRSQARRPASERRGNVQFATLPLTGRDYAEYYKGYANSTLWPLFHSQLAAFSYNREYDQGYQRVNALFARKLLPLLRADDLIWVHDYHLIALARELRRAGVTSPIGFFLHVPFPPLEMLRVLPNYQQLLRDLCEYSLVGFQTRNDLRAFVDCIEQMPGGRSHRGNLVSAWNRRLRVGHFPIGISVNEVSEMATRGRKSTPTRRLRANVTDDRSIIIGVDRLDYSKGLFERFRAYERLLQHYAANRGKVAMIQIAAPSRTDVPHYQEIRDSLNSLAGEINGRFGEYDWIPLHYMNKAFARTTLLGFLSISQVGLVTPVKDGMNLVAKEYIAAQNPDDPGVLVLSCMAGAAQELHEALIVNPYDIDAMAEALEQALTMPLKERQRRWRALMEVLQGNDISAWARGYLAALQRPLT